MTYYDVVKNTRQHLLTYTLFISTIKITSEFKNVSMTVGVVDELALHGKLRTATSTAVVE